MSLGPSGRRLQVGPHRACYQNGPGTSLPSCLASVSAPTLTPVKVLIRKEKGRERIPVDFYPLDWRGERTGGDFSREVLRDDARGRPPDFHAKARRDTRTPGTERVWQVDDEEDDLGDPETGLGECEGVRQRCP